jgi:pimeloyl-ACP methyl ester carboxylesterase
MTVDVAPIRHRRVIAAGDRNSKHAGRALGATLLASAAVLGATACAVWWMARRAERANPPIGRFIDVDGVRLHYVERGEGVPVVLLHGNGSMIQDFATSGVLDRAAERYRVIAFDRPGYGYSVRPRGRLWTPQAQAELLYKALGKLGVDRAIVVGHSWGTLVAVALASRHPESVRSLVLLSGYYFPTPRADVALLSPPALPLIGDVMRYTISPVLGWLMLPLLFRRFFGPAPVPPSFRAGFPVSMALRPSQIRASAAESALLIPAVVTLRRHYRELTMPVVIVAGADDHHIDTGRQSAPLHHSLPGSTLRLVPGVGHMVHQNAPDVVMEAIDQAAHQTAAIGHSAEQQVVTASTS